MPEHRFITEFIYFSHVIFSETSLLLCKQSADKSNIQWREITFQKISFSLHILFKPKPMITNLTRYNCDISSRAFMIVTKRGLGKGGGWRWNERGIGWMQKFWKMSYIYKCINTTTKHMYNLYIYKCFRGLYPTAWFILQNTVSIQGSEFWGRVYYSEKNGVPAVTRMSAIRMMLLPFFQKKRESCIFLFK